MNKITNLTKTMWEKGKKTVLGVIAATSMATMTALPASAATQINPNATTESVIGGILDVIFQISFWLGVVITVIGIFMFLYSFKDERSDLQANGAKTAIVGACLMGLKLLVSITGLIK